MTLASAALRPAPRRCLHPPAQTAGPPGWTPGAASPSSTVVSSSTTSQRWSPRALILDPSESSTLGPADRVVTCVQRQMPGPWLEAGASRSGARRPGRPRRHRGCRAPGRGDRRHAGGRRRRGRHSSIRTRHLSTVSSGSLVGGWVRAQQRSRLTPAFERSVLGVHAHEDAALLRLTDGTEALVDVILVAAGVTPASDFLTPLVPDVRGGIPTDDRLRVAGLERVYAAGDVARLHRGRPSSVASTGATPSPRVAT